MTTAHTVLRQLLRPLDPRRLPTLSLKLAETELRQPLRQPLRASALPFCARRWSLARWLPPSQLPRPQVTFVSRAITATGSVVHALLQHWLRPFLWGEWVCPWCNMRRRAALWTPHLRCRTEGCDGRYISPAEGSDLQYREIELRHRHLPFTGHPDGILRLPHEGRPLLLEIKTIDERELAELTEPLPVHLDYQVGAYGQLLRWSPYQLRPREAILLYVSRNLPFTNSVWWADAGEALAEVLLSRAGSAARPLFKAFRRPLKLAVARAEFALIQRALSAGTRAPLLAPEWRRCAEVAATNETFCQYRFICFASWSDSLQQEVAARRAAQQRHPRHYL